MPQGEVGAIASLLNLPLLEKLPFDPRLAETCDRGTIFVREFPESPLAKQLIAIAHAIGASSRPPTTAGTGN
jgi:MinD-like ATPase involved in chromosome partitioning or flagellar assembly